MALTDFAIRKAKAQEKPFKLADGGGLHLLVQANGSKLWRLKYRFAGKERKRNFVGQHFWARGYFVSTVGRDTKVIREYIRKQEEEDKRLEQMNLWR